MEGQSEPAAAVQQGGLQVEQLEGLRKEPWEETLLGLERTLQLERLGYCLECTLGWGELLVDQLRSQGIQWEGYLKDQ